VKILEINSVCGIKSTGRICTDIADVLKERGHSCVVAYGRENTPDKYKNISYRFTNNLSVITDAILTRIFDNAGFNSKTVTKKFINWVKDYDPDIIHLHNLHGYYINLEILFKYIKEYKKPVVLTLHDCWTFTGHCAYFSNINCEMWKTECHNCPKKVSYPRSMIFDASKRNFKKKRDIFTSIPNLTVVTPSEWLANLTRESFFKNASIKVINNGIDADTFKPTESDFREKYGLQNKKIILGVANMWGKTKGLYDFYKLTELLNENEVVVLVGLTEKQKKELPKNIIGITHTHSKEELASIYTQADVFINPTYMDNYPTVNLEAQACGTPVISYATGGSVESIPPDNIVPQGDVQGLKEKIDKKLMLNNQDFSNKNMINEYIKLFHSLTEN